MLPLDIFKVCLNRYNGNYKAFGLKLIDQSEDSAPGKYSYFNAWVKGTPALAERHSPPWQIPSAVSCLVSLTDNFGKHWLPRYHS